MPVVLLCHCDGTNGSTTFTDTSLSAHSLFAVNATVTTTAPKFGTGSLTIGSGGARLEVGNPQTDFNFGAGQFTIEAWCYYTSSASGIQAVIAQFAGSAGNYGWFLGTSSGQLTLFYSTTGSDNQSLGGNFTPATNTWIHIACDRDASNVLRLYADGVVKASGTVSSTFFASTLACWIGNDNSAVRKFPGNLDEVRVTKGQAMYGGAFTPPTAPFPDPGATTAQARAMVLA